MMKDENEFSYQDQSAIRHGFYPAVGVGQNIPEALVPCPW
jgi:hypothetical protein